MNRQATQTSRATRRAVVANAAATESVTAPRSRGGQAPPAASGSWTFLTNHAHVLILLARDPSRVLREVALDVGITERAVQRIIADLEAERFIEREKVGRRNHYRIRTDAPLRHPIEAHRSIGDLLAAIDLGSA